MLTHTLTNMSRYRFDQQLTKKKTKNKDLPRKRSDDDDDDDVARHDKRMIVGWPPAVTRSAVSKVDVILGSSLRRCTAAGLIREREEEEEEEEKVSVEM